MQRIGLMGGSFNPIHNGHLNMATAALESGMVDRVIFLPSGNPPHKRAGLADKLDRYAMTCLAVEGRKDMSVSREEIDREGIIYTVDTLTRLQAQMPDAQLHYLIGADTVHQLHTWRRAQDVIRLCTFLVMMRPGEERQGTLERMAYWQAQGAKMACLEGTLKDISSTDIRRRIEAGEDVGDLLPGAVYRYILEHRLYDTGDHQ